MSTDKEQQEILLEIVRKKVINLISTFEKENVDSNLKKIRASYVGPNEEPEEVYALSYSELPSFKAISSHEDVEKIAKSWALTVRLQKDSGTIHIKINEHKYEDSYGAYLISANTDIERWLEYAGKLFNSQK